MLCLLLPGMVSAWQDPLSGSEEAAAVSLALSDKLNNRAENTTGTSGSANTVAIKARPALQARQAIASADNTSSAITLGREVLLVELLYQKQKKSSASESVQQRIAEVFLFDYASGKTSRYEIDVNTNDVLREQAVASPHLPLNDREQSAAVSMLVNDASAFAAISSEYQRHFGQALQGTDNIDMKVLVWQPPAANTSTAASDCRTQRCALISVFTNNNFSFSVEPVVNLMTQNVYTGVIR